MYWIIAANIRTSPDSFFPEHDAKSHYWNHAHVTHGAKLCEAPVGVSQSLRHPTVALAELKRWVGFAGTHRQAVPISTNQSEDIREPSALNVPPQGASIPRIEPVGAHSKGDCLDGKRLALDRFRHS